MMTQNLFAASPLLVLLLCFHSCTQERKENTGQKEFSYKQTNEVFEWRGANRAGIYYEDGLLKSWPEGGPELVWEYEGVGNGFGSPVFTPENMYILGEIDNQAYLFAFDLEGNLLWKNDIGNEWVREYGGSRSTPTIVGDLIYATTGLGNLCCMDRDSGEKKWTVNMFSDLHGTFPSFGYSESVVVADEKVFCNPGGIDTNVVALNCFTGDIIWTSKGAGELHAYHSPLIIKLNDRSVLASFTAYELMGHDTETGQLLWKHDQNYVKPSKRVAGNDEAHSNAILYENGFIYYATTGAGKGGVKLELAENGEKIREVWCNKAFDGFMGGIVKLGDYLYGCGTAKRGLKCINSTTGKTEKVLKIGNGAVIAADGMLYYYNYAGDVFLISLEGKNMEVVSEFKIRKGSKEHFAHPVINNGKLYIRHGTVIQAFNIFDNL